MGGEVIAFAEGFDRAFTLQFDLQGIYRKHIPITMLTDSKQVFDVLTKGSRTAEHRLMIDILAAREAYMREDIESIGLVPSSDNLADGLTKWKNASRIVNFMHAGFDSPTVSQWILRESSRSSN